MEKLKGEIINEQKYGVHAIKCIFRHFNGG